MHERIAAMAVFFVYLVATAKSLSGLVIVAPFFALCSYAGTRDRDSIFTLNDSLIFFLILYFCVAPCQTLDEGYFADSHTTMGLQYSLADIITAMTIVFLFSVPMLVVSSRGTAAYQDLSLRPKTPISHQSSIVVMFISAACALQYISLSGGLEILTKGRNEQNNATGTILEPLLLSLAAVGPAVVLSASFVSVSRTPPVLCGLAICTALLSICVNPFNSARFFLMASWLPITFSAFKGQASFRITFLVLFFGALIVAPILSITTRIGASDISALWDLDISNLFKLRDADVFETLVHSIGYVRDHGHTNGNSLMAIVLFAIPRTLWVTKPILGGLLVGGDLYDGGASGTDNLSFFPGADAYLDFGILAVPIAGAFLGLGFRLMTTRGPVVSTSNLLSLVAMGSTPILLRGPFGAVCGYPLCLIIATLIHCAICQFVEASQSTFDKQDGSIPPP